MSKAKQNLERVESQADARQLASLHGPVAEARQQYESAAIAVQGIERTLHSWRVSEDEIAEVRSDAAKFSTARTADDLQLIRKWSEIEVRAPLAGVVLENNLVVGKAVNTRQDLVKTCDISTLGVKVEMREEDLPILEAMDANSRHWLIRLAAQPEVPGIPGSFEVIGHLVDPQSRTVPVMGWLDNSAGSLKAGQPVAVEIALR
jgi:cobalt-zinc-cadmium efflux system membrane fusion protein